ncbi:MAG: apolipoprotein N-acyltransferase [Candidatus Omnitrophica bacterium]|nr:apolipoprotein N-acyltransferase [Candidatus Omnitrophota bacterium]
MNLSHLKKGFSHTFGQALGIILLQLLFASVGDSLMAVRYWDAILCIILGLLVKSGKASPLLAIGLLSVTLNLFADPASGMFFCVWFSLIPCFVLIRRIESWKEVFGWGQWVGTLLALGVFSWLGEAIETFAGISAPFAFLIALGVGLIIGFQYTLFFFLTKLLHRRSPLPLGFAGALAYTLTEYWAPFPLPLNLALAFSWTPLLIQVTDLVGMVGTSFLIAVVSGALYEIVMNLRRGTLKQAAVSAGVLVLILAGQVAYGFYCLKKYTPDPDAPSLDIAMIQPMSPLKVRNSDTEIKEEAAKNLVELSKEVIEQASSPPDLLVWPEGAAPFAYRSPKFNPEYLAALKPFQDENPVPILVQDIEFRRIPGLDRIGYTSNATLIDGSGEIVDSYAKNLLLPFGEYLPGAKQLPFLKKIFPETRSIQAGPGPRLLKGPGGEIVPLICYEVLFPNYVRRFCNLGGNYMVNQTNDRWYGPKQQPRQHLAFAVFRAVENRLPLVRVTNSGISALIDARGIIETDNQTPPLSRGILRGRIHPREGGSLYARFGDLLSALILTPLGLLLLFTHLRKQP